MTSNHDYMTPSKGATDWHVPLNENFDQIDTDVEIRDTEANRGDYTPKEGAKFFATDTGRRFHGEGGEWVEMPPQPLTQLTVPNVATDPTDSVPGTMWYNTETNTLKVQLSNGAQPITSGESTSGSDGGSDGTEHTLMIEAADGASWDQYKLVIDGEITEEIRTDSGDSITEQDDGTVLIEGGVKDGKSEGYSFTGSLVSFSLSVDGMAYLDGEAIDESNY
jgi:hypothetical protein